MSRRLRRPATRCGKDHPQLTDPPFGRILKARTFDAQEYEGGIVAFSLAEVPAEAEGEAETPAPAEKAPAQKTGGRRKAKAAS